MVKTVNKMTVDELLRDSMINHAIDTGNTEMLKQLSGDYEIVKPWASGMIAVRTKEFSEMKPPFPTSDRDYLTCEYCGSENESVEYDAGLQENVCDHCHAEMYYGDNEEEESYYS
jgi:hypothetical protein